MIEIKQETIVEQLIDVYYKEEWWQSHSMTPEQASLYHSTLIDKGNIKYVEIDGRLVGYVEFWRINFEQFGKLICQVPFSAYLEDVQNGKICYVANVWIDKEYRNSSVIKQLKLMFFKANYHCDYFVGEAMRKKTQPIKVFTRKDFYNKYVKE